MSKKSKNKMKAWRRMSKKYWDEEKQLWVRQGRQLKMFTMGYDVKKGAHGLLAALIGRLDSRIEREQAAVKNLIEKDVNNETK
jgi:hypothetical protein